MVLDRGSAVNILGLGEFDAEPVVFGLLLTLVYVLCIPVVVIKAGRQAGRQADYAGRLHCKIGKEVSK